MAPMLTLILAAAAALLPWIHDDYAAALARARAENKPIVVDLWAPWCHTCLAMQQTVLADPALADVAGRFIWLALDTDRPQNFAAVDVLRPGAWPTFYVIDPKDESVLARQVGSCSPAEWRAFLEAGQSAGAGAVEIRAADGLAAAGRAEEAVARYATALAALPAGDARRAPALVSWIGTLWKLERFRDCADLGLARLAETGANLSASAADFTWYAHECAVQTQDEALAARMRTAALAPDAPLRRILADPRQLSVDDHADALRILRELTEAGGDVAGARKIAESQMDLLLKARAAAADATGRMALGWPLAEVAGYLGRGAELVPLLQANTAELPTEYDPPYRLAGVLLKLGRHDEALAAARQAEAHVYGPRKARVLALIAGIHEARGDRPAQKAAWQAVVDWQNTLPESQRSAGLEKQARAALEALAQPATPPAP